MAVKTGIELAPILRFSANGNDSAQRGSIRLVAKSSAAIYLGAFVPLVLGSDAAPAGIEFGVPVFADDNIVGGVVTGFYRKGSSVPIWEDAGKAGTVTEATATAPLKYTFAATNGEASGTSALLELVEIKLVLNGDIWETLLVDGSGLPVARGTTVAYGTTNSSANTGVGLAVDPTYPWALTEAGAAVLLANKDFYTLRPEGSSPANQNRVFVSPIRGFASLKVAE